VNYFVNGGPAGSWDARALNLTIGPSVTLQDNARKKRARGRGIGVG